MIRLGIAVEGKTEIEFVNSVLVQHFLELDITAFALPVGIAKIREECPRFNEWLEQLEALGR